MPGTLSPVSFTLEHKGPQAASQSLAPGPSTVGDLNKMDARGSDASAVGTLPNSQRTQK